MWVLMGVLSLNFMDAERLSVDPVMRAITGKKDNGKQAASSNTIGRFETDILTQRENLTSLSVINGRWVQKAMGKTEHRRIILDMDSSESPADGEQEGSAYNLGNFLRRLALPRKIKHWSLRSLLSGLSRSAPK